MRPKIEIILVRYNRPDLEAATIRHVLDTVEYPNWSLTAYQNAPGVGLAKTWNRLIAASDAEYICLLNTDVIPAMNWLGKLADVLDQRPEIVAVVPSSNKVHLSQVSIPDGWVVQSPQDAFQVQANLAPIAPTQLLPTCSAMCVLFRREAWANAGGFDEEFTFYGEDTEFFYRMRAMGLGQILWCRRVYVHHLGAQSFGRAVDEEGLDYGKLRDDAMRLWLQRKAEIDAQYPEKALDV